MYQLILCAVGGLMIVYLWNQFDQWWEERKESRIRRWEKLHGRRWSERNWPDGWLTTDEDERRNDRCFDGSPAWMRPTKRGGFKL